MVSSLKLTIELVPATSWYNNMRSLMPKAAWDTLRKKVYADFKYACGICGKNKVTLHCHEIWKYDDQNHIQNLIGLIALCELCHAVKHIGLANLQAHQGKLDFNKVVAHFMKVNNCDKKIFVAHRQNAFTIWEERSKHPWQLSINNNLIEI